MVIELAPKPGGKIFASPSLGFYTICISNNVTLHHTPDEDSAANDGVCLGQSVLHAGVPGRLPLGACRPALHLSSPNNVFFTNPHIFPRLSILQRRKSPFYQCKAQFLASAFPGKWRRGSVLPLSLCPCLSQHPGGCPSTSSCLKVSPRLPQHGDRA